MTSPAAERRFTFLEYLELEKGSEQHHEFVDGYVYAMSGGSPDHSRLASNVIGLLSAQLTGKPCQAFTSDLRVRVLETGLATHPDVSVFCGNLERDLAHEILRQLAEKRLASAEGVWKASAGQPGPRTPVIGLCCGSSLTNRVGTTGSGCNRCEQLLCLILGALAFPLGNLLSRRVPATRRRRLRRRSAWYGPTNPNRRARGQRPLALRATYVSASSDLFFADSAVAAVASGINGVRGWLVGR